MINGGKDMTADDVRTLADRTDLETLIRLLNEAGNLNHLSLTCDGHDGRSFVALFRDTIGTAPYRYMSGQDPVQVLKLALASVAVVQPKSVVNCDRKRRKTDSDADFI